MPWSLFSFVPGAAKTPHWLLLGELSARKARKAQTSAVAFVSLARDAGVGRQLVGAVEAVRVTRGSRRCGRISDSHAAMLVSEASRRASRRASRGSNFEAIFDEYASHAAHKRHVRPQMRRKAFSRLNRY